MRLTDLLVPSLAENMWLGLLAAVGTYDNLRQNGSLTSPTNTALIIGAWYLAGRLDYLSEYIGKRAEQRKERQLYFDFST